MPSSFFPVEQSFPVDFNTPAVSGLEIPKQFHWLRVEHPPLAGMQLPSQSIPWAELYRNGFRWIVCLCSDQPLYDPSPLRSLIAVELCDLAETELPEDPEMEEGAIRVIAKAIVQRLEQGEGVIVHCAGGRGRTGTVIGSVLVKMGYSPTGVISYLNELHSARGKVGWPESKWQSAVVERSHGNLSK